MSNIVDEFKKFKSNNNYEVVKKGSWAFPDVIGNDNDDLKLFIPKEPVNYFTIVSKKRNQPIFTFWASDKISQLENTTNTYSAGFLKSNRPSFAPCEELNNITSNDYKATGFSKGHQVAMADMKLLEGDDNPSAGYDTFRLCNISPQNERMNGDPWASLEEATRDCATKGDMAVFTGPLFLDGGKYCMKTGMCDLVDSKSPNNCNNYLNKDKVVGNKTWYGNENNYDKCENGTNNKQITVPSAFYKVVFFKETLEVYPVIMSQEIPGQGYPTSPNGTILAAGSGAWDIIRNSLKDVLNFSQIQESKIKCSNSDSWLNKPPTCPKKEEIRLKALRVEKQNEKDESTKDNSIKKCTDCNCVDTSDKDNFHNSIILMLIYGICFAGIIFTVMKVKNENTVFYISSSFVVVFAVAATLMMESTGKTLNLLNFFTLVAIAAIFFLKQKKFL